MPPLTLHRRATALFVTLNTSIALLVATPGQARSAPSQADLQVTKLTLDKANVTVGGTVTGRADLINRGPGVASSVAVKYDLVRISNSTKTALATSTGGALARGATASIVTTLSLPAALAPGTYNVTAIASTSTKDGTPANNIASVPLEVQAAASTTTTSSTTSTTSTASCSKYQSFFDGVYQSATTSLNASAASGNGETYYTLSYALDGMLGMFEGTRDAKYLEQTLTWAEKMVAGATIVDINGKRNWKGAWASPYSSIPITYQIHEFQGSQPLARLSRIILTDSGLKGTYGSRAQVIYRFVKDHIVDKWLYARKAESSFRYQAANNRTYPGPMALLDLMVLDLARIDSNPAYLSLATALTQGFTARLESHSNGSLIWDRAQIQPVQGLSFDTSHANRYAVMMAQAQAAGIVVTQAQLDGVARLLTEVIWNKSSSNPQFTNLIDGTNPWIGSNPPYGLGQIYSGWATLGARDARARAVAEATLQALISGVRNPSLDFMRSSVGKMDLAGHVTRNMRVAGLCGISTVTASTTTKPPTTSTTTTSTSTTATSPTTSTTTTTMSSTASTTSTTSPTTSTTTTTTTTSPTTSTTSTSTVSCRKYQPYFDSVLQSMVTSLNANAVSGNGPTYYTFSYPLDGMLGMFEGTGDVKYLEQALGWAEQMAAGAKIVDYQGKRNWTGTWASPYASTPITHLLWEVQGAAPLARLSRIVLTDPDLKAVYGVRAQAIYRFMKDHIVDKWLYARHAESSFRYQAMNNRTYPDTIALFALSVLDLARVDSNPAYISLVRDLVAGFTARLQQYTGQSLIWDREDIQAVAGYSFDTSHANRYPYLMGEAYAAGVVDETQLNGIARLLTEVIWDKSTSNPQFTNLIDGTNPWIGSNPPYGLGLIYSGWATLGAHDSRARMVAEITLQAIMAGVRNPSLDYMRSGVGKMALAGHVTRNLSMGGVCE